MTLSTPVLREADPAVEHGSHTSSTSCRHAAEGRSAPASDTPRAATQPRTTPALDAVSRTFDGVQVDESIDREFGHGKPQVAAAPAFWHVS